MSTSAVNSRLDALYQQMLDAINDGNFLEKHDFLEQLMALATERQSDGMPLYLLGLCSYQEGEYKSAIAMMEEALEREPEAFEPAELLAILYAKVGKPKQSLYYAKLALVQTKRSDFEYAIPTWVDGFSDAFLSTNSHPQFREAKFKLRLRDVKEARELAREAVKLHPDHAESWAVFYETSLRTRSYKDCLDALQGLWDLKDSWRVGFDTKDLWQHASFILSMLGQNDQANEFGLVAAEALEKFKTTENPAYQANIAKPIFSFDHIHFATGDHLKIGFLSERFGQDHGLDMLIELIFRHRQPSLYCDCFSLRDAGDAMTDIFATNPHRWHDLSKVDNRTAAQIIYNEQLDILIDLDGDFGLRSKEIMPFKPSYICGTFEDFWRERPDYFDVVFTKKDALVACMQPISRDKLVSNMRYFRDVKIQEPVEHVVILTGTDGLTEKFWVQLSHVIHEYPDVGFEFFGPMLGSPNARQWVQKRLEEMGLETAKVSYIFEKNTIPLERALLDVDIAWIPHSANATSCLMKAIEQNTLPLVSNSTAFALNMAYHFLKDMHLEDLYVQDDHSFISLFQNVLSGGDWLSKKYQQLRACQERMVDEDDSKHKGRAFLESAAELRKVVVEERLAQNG